MAYLPLADLIAGPVRLSPAEAAALTLAVARRLDEETSDGREPQVPDDRGILLSSTGTIAFVRGPQAAARDNRTALSALLMRLLRLEDGRPRGHVPGALQIVLARNLGYIQLPPTSPDAFRAALEGFASSDPTLLAGIFWRAARVKGAVRHRASSGAESTPSPVERRRTGATRAELRRALRDVERELYDTRVRLLNRPAPRRARGPLGSNLSTAGLLRWAGVAAGVVLLASFAAGHSSRTSPRDVALGVSTDVGATPAIATGQKATGQRTVTVRGSVPEQTARAGRASSIAHPPSASRPRAPRRGRRPILPDAARQFAGGARSISWNVPR